MRRRLMITAAAAAVVVVVVCGAPAANASSITAVSHRPALAAGGAWGTATVVPGTAALNADGRAQLNSVSCTTAGNCGAGGYYEGIAGFNPVQRAFVDSETNGVWRQAEQVPGMSALHASLYASVASVSCASAGNCSAVGSYAAEHTSQRGFAVTETDGAWGMAVEVTGALGKANAYILSVSCGAAGNCSAAGYYNNAHGKVQAFVVSETGGTWGTAEVAPGTAVLNQGEKAGLTSVSCASTGNCAAGGYYSGSSGQEALVVSETGGTWGTAAEVPGTATLNTGGAAQLNSLSCASTGNCAAGGYYYDAGDTTYEPFVTSETEGTWGTAEKAPGIAALNRVGSAFVDSVSCGTAGNCSAGGYYDIHGTVNTQAYVLTEIGGTWRPALNVPGTTAQSSVASVSCTPAGHCAAGGVNPDSSGHYQAFVVSRT